MDLKRWLLFAVSVAAVFVAFLGVNQLKEFNSYFRDKNFYSRSNNYPENPPNVVPLSGDRFAVVEDGNNVTVYGVDANGRLSVKDSLTAAKYSTMKTKYRATVVIE